MGHQPRTRGPLQTLGALALTLLAASSARALHDESFPAHFESVQVPGSFTKPVDLVFLPDGTIFVAEKRGSVRYHDGTSLQAPYVIDLIDEVNKTGDRGLLGLALHPGWVPDGGPNSWMYLLYTVSPVPGEDLVYNEDDKYSFGRLTRYKLIVQGSDIVADESTREILLGNQLPDGTVPDGFANIHSSHSNGVLDFASDGSLIISTGDGAHFDAMDTGGIDPAGFEIFVHPVTGLKGPMPIDQDCGALRAQDLRSLAGKILRIDPETGNGYPSNPFYDGDPTSHASRVWALGLRNAFRVGLVPGTGSSDPTDGNPGTIVIGDVGWQDWEEINVCNGGENFGWPCFEGPYPDDTFENFQYVHNPNNCFDCANLGPGILTGPAVSWEHDDPTLLVPPGVHVDEDGVPQNGFAGSCAVGGAHYPGGDYPESYTGRWFFADYADDWVRTVSFDAQYNVIEVADFAFDTDTIVDIEAHPITGDIHLLVLGQSAGEGHIDRVRYGANLTPIASAEASPTFGDVPLVVDFDASDSTDPENDPLEYTWDFKDGSPPEMGANVQHTFTTDGLYDVEVTVTDDGGLSDTDEVQIAVGNVPPVARIASPLPGATFEAPQTLLLSGTGMDFQGSDLTFQWEVDLYHDTHVHPGFFSFPGETGTIDVEPHGNPSELYYLRIELIVENEGGLVDKDQVFVYPIENVFDPTGTSTPITRMQELMPPYPTGAGNLDPEVFRDGDFPPVGSDDRLRQYDTFHDGDQGADDWVGFEIGYTPQDIVRFTSLQFQEGMHFTGGGWFESFRVEVRDGGVWSEAESLKVLPGYPFQVAHLPGFDGVNYDTYELHFDPIYGDAIRLRGDPGGASGYISAGELRVRWIDSLPPPTPWRDLTEDGAVITKLFELVPPQPQGEGNKDPEVIRNGTWPAVGSASKFAQVDTFHFGTQGNEDWVGYSFGAWQTFNRVLFQEGYHYPNGGWFDVMGVETRTGSAAPWTPVTGLAVTPPVPGDTTTFGTYETFELLFDPVVGREIRVVGEPGGIHDFISIGELRVFGPDFDGETCGWETYGEGLGGTNVLTLSSTTAPLLGFPVLVEAAGAPSAGPATLFLSTQSVSLPVLGGTLLVNPVVGTPVPIAFDSAGTASLPADLPTNPTFVGSTFFMQVVGADVGQPGVLLFSNGLQLTICP